MRAQLNIKDDDWAQKGICDPQKKQNIILFTMDMSSSGFTGIAAANILAIAQKCQAPNIGWLQSLTSKRENLCQLMRYDIACKLECVKSYSVLPSIQCPNA